MPYQKNKILLNQKLAAEFIASRFKKYWPDAEKVLAVKIDILKNFLGYLRFTLRYRIFIKNNRGKIEEKNIIIKTERPKHFAWPPRIGTVEKDFLATRFLVKNGLAAILPHPLEFYAPLWAYLYEEVRGTTLKNFVQTENWRSNLFFKNIPATVHALKKIHAIKKKPRFANGDHKKSIRNVFFEWLGLIKKYYPAGLSRAEKIVGSLQKLEKKYQNILFNQKTYRVTHGDFQSDNIIIGDNGKIIFIDFADCKFFNPLDDLASFLVQAEMHFKYVRPKNFKELTQKLKKITYAAYFGKKMKPRDALQIDFFAAKDTLRIITFISFTLRAWQTIHDHNKMTDSLLTFAEEKIKNLERKYL